MSRTPAARPSLALYDHEAPGFSDLEREMVAGIPPGGSWQDIPDGLSARVDQIRRRSRERGLVHTTYYGRLRWEAPSYTINTYFSRIGNGCFVHPSQDRLLSLREGARLQSFEDRVKFQGSKRARYEQIGNAVPPLLSHALAQTLEPGHVADLFSGAGGLSMGFELGGSEVAYAAELKRDACSTFNAAHGGEEIAESVDLAERAVRREVVNRIKARTGAGVDILLAGPPCQGFSTAGARSGTDSRNTLLWVPFDIARRVRPRALVIENVQGILSAAGRTLPRRIADEMRDLGMTPHMCVLRADEFGAPQRRTRVFFVGTRDAGWRPPEPVCVRFPKPGPLADAVTVKEAIGDLPPLEAGGGAERSRLGRKARSDYQRWARGEIDVTQLSERRFSAPEDAVPVAA
jgi:DNA (cytosine-5)-methyltransferase 1